MTGRLKITAKVIKRRVLAGEDQDAVFATYSLLTEDEKTEIIATWDEIEV